MSDRERWIVYPLLFLAIGLSLRTKAFVFTGHLKAERLQVDQILDAEQIACRRLVLQNEKGEVLMKFAPSADGTYGVIQPNSRGLGINGRVIANQVNCNELGILGAKRERVMTLSPLYLSKKDGPHELQGGQIIVFDGKNKPQVMVGRSPVGGTVHAFDDAGKGVIIGHVQPPKPGVRWAGLFTVASDGKTIKPLGTKFDTSADPMKKPAEPKIEEEKDTEPEQPKKPAPTDVSGREG